MANHFSALKRGRQTEKRTELNRTHRSRLRTQLRKLRQAIASGSREQADAIYRQTVAVLDKARQQGVIHANTASRYKSRLSARVRAVAAK